MQGLGPRILCTLLRRDEKAQTQGNSTRLKRRFANFNVPKMLAEHHFLLTLQARNTNKYLDEFQKNNRTLKFADR